MATPNWFAVTDACLACWPVGLVALGFLLVLNLRWVAVDGPRVAAEGASVAVGVGPRPCERHGSGWVEPGANVATRRCQIGLAAGSRALCGGGAVFVLAPTSRRRPPETLGARNFRPGNRCCRRSRLLASMTVDRFACRPQDGSHGGLSRRGTDETGTPGQRSQEQRPLEICGQDGFAVPQQSQHLGRSGGLGVLINEYLDRASWRYGYADSMPTRHDPDLWVCRMSLWCP